MLSNIRARPSFPTRRSSDLERLQLPFDLFPLAVGRERSLRAGLEKPSRGGDFPGALRGAGRDGADDLEFDPREGKRVPAVVEERLPHDRHPLGYDLLTNDGGVGANLILRVLVHAKAEEVEEILEVYLPVGLRVRGQREIFPRLLARNSGREARLVRRPRPLLYLSLFG